MAKETTLKEVGEMLGQVVEHMVTKEDVRLDTRIDDQNSWKSWARAMRASRKKSIISSRACPKSRNILGSTRRMRRDKRLLSARQLERAAMCSTRSTIERRSFGFLMRRKDFVSDNPSEVARKSSM
jgi:hypothetical protein